MSNAVIALVSYTLTGHEVTFEGHSASGSESSIAL